MAYQQVVVVEGSGSDSDNTEESSRKRSERRSLKCCQGDSLTGEEELDHLLCFICLALFGVAAVLLGLHFWGGSSTPLPATPSSSLASTTPSPGVAPSPTPTPRQCADLNSCLALIDKSLAARPRNGRGMLQTFGPGSFGGGPCGEEFCALPEPCPGVADGRCRFSVYDNSLAVIYFTMKGQLDLAKPILDGWIELLYPSNSYPDVAIGPLPSGRKITLLAAAYTTEVKAQAPGYYEGIGVADGAVDTGNNAWMGMAFAHYAAASGSSCYAAVAHDVLAALDIVGGCSDALAGFMGGPVQKAWWRSTEHNIDMAAFARMMKNTTLEEKAMKFVHAMYGFDASYPNLYSTGTRADFRCDGHRTSAAAPADTVFWNQLAGADPIKERKVASTKVALEYERTGDNGEKLGGMMEEDTDLIGHAGEGVGDKYTGVRFTNWGHGIQWEVTASAAMALVDFDQAYGAAELDVKPSIAKISDSVHRLLGIYKSMPASILGGNEAAFRKNDPTLDYPGGTNCGNNNVYWRYPHLASTTWTGMMLLQQEAPGLAVNKSANPYATPAGSIPDASKAKQDLSCLPAAPSADAACSSRPACSGLKGDCCPTPEGLMLGCCSR